MTKQWETYEAVIRRLYQEYTLNVVRQIMIEKYNFRASTRAYRGRLIRWGVRKYNTRRPHDDRASASMSNFSGFSNGSDMASPTMPQGTLKLLSCDSSPTAPRRVSDSQISLSTRIGHGYATLYGNLPSPYSLGRDRDGDNCCQPQSDMRNGWPAAYNQSSTPGVGFDDIHGTAQATGPPTYFEKYAYLPATPPGSAYPPNTGFETSLAPPHHGLGYYQPPRRHNSTAQMNLPALPIPDFGRGQAAAGSGYRIDSTDGSLTEEDIKRSPSHDT
ncbi:hypothetical protein F5Y15DRAFT_385295 [Xylariaceae sp. FL0016]|nr:hypothetical protein F5Y15DRAFT_385295 [Xylariaceae sp. FL0016]